MFLSGLMGFVATSDKSTYYVNDVPTFRITGAKPNSSVFAENYVNGNNIEGDSLGYTDGNGELNFSPGPFYSFNVGNWKKVFNVIDPQGNFDTQSISFTVSPGGSTPPTIPTIPTRGSTGPTDVMPPTTPPATTNPVTSPRTIGTPREPISRGGTIAIGEPIPDPRPVVYVQPDILAPYETPPIINVPEDQIPVNVPTYPTVPSLPQPPAVQQPAPAGSGFDLSGSMNIAGYQIPIWALGVGVAVLFFASKGR